MSAKDKEKVALSKEVKDDLVIRIVLFSLATLFVASLGSWLIYRNSETVEAGDCKKESIVFTNYATTDSKLYLFPEEGEYYGIVDYATYIADIDEIKKLCDEKKRFTVYSKSYVSDLGEVGNIIYELSYQDKTFFSFEDAKERNGKSIMLIACFFGGFTVFFILMLIGSIIVSGDPYKHYFLARLLYRKDDPIFFQ